PEGRYATAKELAAEVEHWLADEPVAAYRDPLPVRLGRWARRNKGWVIAGAAVVLACVAAQTAAMVVSEQGRLRIAAEQEQTAREGDQKDGPLQAETRAREAETQARSLAMAALRKLTDDVVEQQLARRTVLTDEDRRFLRDIQRRYEEF